MMQTRLRSKLVRGGLLVALLSMLLIGPGGALALLQQIGDTPSPATGHAQIVAQGVSFLPGSQSAWRIVEDTAEPLDVAWPESRALGFAIALDQGILINDYTYGTQTRLAAGEAAFVASGASQQRVSLTGGNVPHLRIGLVPAGEANDAGDDRLIYSGDPFTPPDGRRDIDLLRDVLQEGERSLVRAGEAPTLVYVISGTVEVAEGSRLIVLAAGESAEINGEFTVEGVSGEAVFVAAVIGPSVPAPPRFSGTVTLDYRACPAHVTRETLEANAANGSAAGFEECAPIDDPAAAGVVQNLNLPDGGRLRLSQARLTDEPGVVVWDGLVFGDYVLGRVQQFPDGYADYLITDGNLNIVQRGNFTLSRDNLDVYRVVYLLAEDEPETGSITVNYHLCQVASIDDFDPEQCAPLEDGVSTELIINDAPSQTLTDAERLASGSFRWSDLAVATTEDPAGSDQGFYLLAFEIDETSAAPQVIVLGADWIEAAGAYGVSLTPSSPSAVVNYYVVNVTPDDTGSISIVGVLCPTAGADNATCDANGTVLMPGAVISTEGAGGIDQTQATQSGNAWVWSGLLLDYIFGINAQRMTPPDGYVIARIVYVQTGASALDHSLTLTDAAPSADFIIYLDPVAAPPVDTDGDGLTDDEETGIYGTDPTLFDTDGDCFGDGTEVNAETDPLDAASFPDGDCDAP